MKTLVRTILGRLPFSLRYELFYQSARALGIKSYEVSGSAGSFVGPLYDQAIIRSYLREGVWSRNIIDLFTGFFERRGPGTFYDIGANIGMIAVPIGRLPHVEVVAFEPDPHNCSLLRANAAIARVSIEIVNAAVAAERGMLRFARNDYNSGDHRLSDDGDLVVEAIPLSERPVPAGPIAVKIDTQGAEPLVFAGGEELLSKADLIVAEFWPYGMKRMKQDAGPVLDFARRHFEQGALIYHDEPLGELRPISEVLEKLQAIIARGGENDQADLVLARP